MYKIYRDLGFSRWRSLILAFYTMYNKKRLYKQSLESDKFYSKAIKEYNERPYIKS